MEEHAAQRLARQAEENALKALKERAAGNRKIADGHRLLGKSIEIGQHHTKQSADNRHKAHALIASGHEMLARADEMLAEANSAAWRAAASELAMAPAP